MTRESDEMMKDLRGYCGELFDNKGKAPDEEDLKKKLMEHHRLICGMIDVFKIMRDRGSRKKMEEIIDGF